MPTVWIPPQMRDLTDGRESILVTADSVRQAINALEQTFPGIRERLCDGDLLRPGLAIIVDQEIAGLGMDTPLGSNSEIHFLPAIGGG